MTDPYRLFKASPGKHRTLKALWPELYACLAGTGGKSDPGEAGPPPKQYHCCIGSCYGLPKGQRPLAVGRLSRWGAPACKACLAKLADKPGGWPLELEKNR